jgi:SAM-dependent methyltransferase
LNGPERVVALLGDEDRVRAGASPVVRDGYLDLVPGPSPAPTGAAQRLMLTGAVPRIYERWWRPALGRAAKGVLGPGMADERRIARLMLGLTPGDGILDVACGPGNFTRDFGRTVGQSGLAVGIDASPTMLARAARDTPESTGNVVYVRGDAVRLPFRDESFDAVCCFAALHLFADPSAALDHMTRVLTPGGRIALFTSCRTRSGPLRTLETVAGAGSGMRMFERDEVAEALAARGFGEIRRRISGFTQFVGGRRARR